MSGEENQFLIAEPVQEPAEEQEFEECMTPRNKQLKRRAEDLVYLDSVCEIVSFLWGIRGKTSKQ